MQWPDPQPARSTYADPTNLLDAIRAMNQRDLMSGINGIYLHSIGFVPVYDTDGFLLYDYLQVHTALVYDGAGEAHIIDAHTPVFNYDRTWTPPICHVLFAPPAHPLDGTVPPPWHVRSRHSTNTKAPPH